MAQYFRTTTSTAFWMTNVKMTKKWHDRLWIKEKRSKQIRKRNIVLHHNIFLKRTNWLECDEISWIMQCHIHQWPIEYISLILLYFDWFIQLNAIEMWFKCQHYTVLSIYIWRGWKMCIAITFMNKWVEDLLDCYWTSWIQCNDFRNKTTNIR